MNLVANSRLGIVKYNPRNLLLNIHRESGATRSLRTLWVPEEDTRILLVAGGLEVAGERRRRAWPAAGFAIPFQSLTPFRGAEFQLEARNEMASY